MSKYKIMNSKNKQTEIKAVNELKGAKCSGNIIISGPFRVAAIR